MPRNFLKLLIKRSIRFFLVFAQGHGHIEYDEQAWITVKEQGIGNS